MNCDFFGKIITVAGLLTGQDIAAQLSDKELGEKLFIPKVTLKADEPVFLDDMTLDELSEKLGVEVIPPESTGMDFVSKLLY